MRTHRSRTDFQATRLRDYEEGLTVTMPTILLVEDSPDDELLTLRALRKNGMGEAVVVARDGVEAIEYLRSARSLPGLVLLDAKLPGMNGAEVLESIRADQRLKSLFVAVLTSAEEDGVMDRDKDAQADLFIRKGVNYDQFLEEIRGLKPLLIEVAARRRPCADTIL